MCVYTDRGANLKALADARTNRAKLYGTGPSGIKHERKKQNKVRKMKNRQQNIADRREANQSRVLRGGAGWKGAINGTPVA